MRRLVLGLFAISSLVACSDDRHFEAVGHTEQALSRGLVFSAIYGGPATGPYKNDWAEIFNRGPTAVSLSGLYLQYSRADYRTWDVAANKIALTGTIPAGGYYLVKLGANTTGTTDLPTADLTGTVAVATGGAIFALTSDATTLDCGPPPPVDGGVDPDGGAATACTSSAIIDLVGYGTTGASPAPSPVWEGSGAAPTGAATSVIRRKGNGCVETDNNAADFELVAITSGPAPRNSASPVNKCTDGIVISQVFGGGSATSATYKYDYVELFNRTDNPLALSGMSLQYSRADQAIWSVLPLPSVVVPAGRYYLIRVFSSPTTPVGADLPTPDLLEVGAGVNYGTNSGLVALVNDLTPLTCGYDAGACTSSSIVDFVGYGAGDTVRPPTVYETSPAPRTADGSQAVLRKNGGCTDTNDNGADFAVGTPAARNSASAENRCSLLVADAGSDADDGSVPDAVVPDAADAADSADTADTSVADGAMTDADEETSVVDSSTEDTADTAPPQDSSVTPADTGNPATDTGLEPLEEDTLKDDGCTCSTPRGSDSRNTASPFAFVALAGALTWLRRRR